MTLTREQVVNAALALRDLDETDGSMILSEAVGAVRRYVEDRGGDLFAFDQALETGDPDFVCVYPEPGEAP